VGKLLTGIGRKKSVEVLSRHLADRYQAAVGICDVLAVYSESVSVAVLLAVFGSGTLLGELTVTVSEIDPVVDALIVPLVL